VRKAAHKSSVGRDIREIRPSLAFIARAIQRLTPPLQAAAASAASLRLSAARRTALKLQGQYMGHLRSLKPRQKARVKALRATKGVRPAIAFARRLGKL
jgi:hypothetical protein